MMEADIEEKLEVERRKEAVRNSWDEKTELARRVAPPQETNGKAVNQQEVLILLLAGFPITKVSEKSGVPRRTIYRWMNNPEFSGELERRRQELSDAAFVRLETLFDKALNCLEAALEKGSVPAAVAILKVLTTQSRGRIQGIGDEDPEIPA